ncbi:MAG: hypothetical protein U9R58_00135 [Chloroflexota bacterium]|nr:hypothetical protein [Chloroflexota bacterium]
MKISLGDRVRIIETSGFVVEGEVLEAVNHGTEQDANWEIDVQSDYGEYYIWKQTADGGTVEKIGFEQRHQNDLSKFVITVC